MSPSGPHNDNCSQIELAFEHECYLNLFKLSKEECIVMKSIETSIEGDHLLPKFLLTEELDKEMAGCDLVPTDSKNSPNFKLKPDLEAVQDIIKKQIHMSSSNGYLDDVSDDDFELVVDSSSDECEVPVKKVDEDTISAPQIVQEIKDILGIHNGTAETEYELEGKDITTVECLDPDVIVEEDDIKSQNEIINVNYISKKMGLVVDITPEQQHTKWKTRKEETSKTNALVQSQSTSHVIGTARSDVPSNENREFEIRCDSLQCKSLDSVTDNTKSNLTVGNAGEVSDKEEMFSETVKHMPYNDDNITLSQSSNLSESSVEWTVIDSVETSDEEKSDQLKQNSSKEVDTIVENQHGNRPNICNGWVDSPLAKNCEGYRKRVACDDVSHNQFKKPKLNIDEPNPSEVKTLKRSLSMIENNEAKRIKSIVGIEKSPGIIVDSSKNNINSVGDINISKNEICETREADNDDTHLDRNGTEKSVVAVLVSEEIPLQKCDIKEHVNSNCLNNKKISSDRTVTQSLTNHVEKESCEIIPENSTISPKIICDNVEQAISNEESNIKLNERTSNEFVENHEKSEYNQDSNIRDIPCLAHRDTQLKALAIENANSTENANIKLINKQEVSEHQEGKNVINKNHSLVNNQSCSKRSDSVDIDIVKTKAMSEIYQEVKSVVIPQDINYNQEHSLIVENSASRHGQSADDELIEKQEMPYPDQEDNICDNQCELLNDKCNSLDNEKGDTNCSESGDIDLIKNQELSELDQEDKTCGILSQVFNNNQEQQSPLNDTVDGWPNGSASNKLVINEEKSHLDHEKKSLCIPSKTLNVSQEQSLINEKDGVNPNDSASMDLISKEEILHIGQKDSCSFTSQVLNNNQERSLNNIKAESKPKVHGNSTYEVSQIQGICKLNEEKNSFEIMSQVLTDGKEQLMYCKETDSSPNGSPSLDLINRLEQSKPNLDDIRCGITSKDANNSLKQCSNLVDLSADDSSFIGTDDKSQNIEDDNSCRIPSLILNENSEIESIKFSDIAPNDLVGKEQNVDKLDETRSEEKLSLDIINQREPELNQEETSSELPSNTLKDNEKQTLTNEEDAIEEIQSSNSNEEQPHVYEIDVNMTDISKDNNETGEINNQSIEVPNLAKTIELRENNSSVSKSRSSPFQIANKSFHKKITPKSSSNLDLAIESVVEKSRRNTLASVPLLSKFHKDKLKKMTRVDLEEAVVLKVCEAITDRSELGQLRLRVQNLEQNNEMWRKKAIQFEKQNRELEMVLKRFLTETAQIKRDNQNKVPLPIKVTRSVGLQVVLASSVNGALVSSKSKLALDSNKNENSYSRLQSNQQQQRHPQMLLPKRPDKEPAKDPQKRIPFSSPLRAQPTINNSTSSRGRDRLKQRANSSAGVSPSPHLGTSVSASTTTLQASPSASSTPQLSPPKMSSPNTTSKSLNTLTPVKNKSTPTKDNMEVIDLTDREDKNKGLPQSQTIGTSSVRVAPSTQVCFVQQSPGSTPAQPMYALVQKPGRQQYLVATSSASSPMGGLQPRPVMTVTPRPTNTLTALPVFRAGGGQIIPVQTTPVNVRPSNLGNTPVRQVPQAIRFQPQIKVLKHPAPLPSVPQPVLRPGTKAPPPKPTLKIAKTVNGIMLSWSMSLTKDLAEMASYQLYAYQEASQPPSTNLWKKVGDVKALPLPMACTLTQFIDGHKYHFAVRAVDIHGRIGPFSYPGSILLTK